MRLRLLRPAVLACLLLTGARLSAAETLSNLRSAAACEARLKKDLSYLASDELEGRGVSTRGIGLAADYVAAEFRAAGLKPAGKGGSYFQPFTMPGAVLQRPATLELTGPEGQVLELTAGKQFEPMGVSGSGEVRAPVVFVGYGITSKQPDIDDYAGLDVEGKVVIVLRDTPRTDVKDAFNRMWRSKYRSLTEKMTNAQAHKAAAVLFVNDRDTARDGDDLLTFPFSASGGSLLELPDLPALHVRRDVVEKMLGTSLEAVERDIDRDLKPRSCELTGWTAKADVAVWRARNALKLKNVVGVVEGSGKLANETIVIGAHYDHVGYGGTYSLSSSKKMAIHHGADDNGSGTTALLELARRFGAQQGREGRRLLFIAFSGEESGLLGSEAYCKDPLYPLKETAAMINLDMVGRLRKHPDKDKDLVLVEGSGTAKTFNALLDDLAQKHDFVMTKKASGFGPSDHASFDDKNVPVIFYWTGDHDDYHRPGDTADKINYPGMRKVVELAEDTVARLASVAPRPEYVEIPAPKMARSYGGGPRLGIRPSYSDDGEGVVLGGVSDDGPAYKAGLKKGDRIIEMAGKRVKNLTGYMELLYTQKAGSTIDVTVIRDKEKKVIKVTLE
jgi:hypothetical protein